MSVLRTGFEELARVGDRTVKQGAILLERHRLSKAEYQLGVLGWQQADFGPEVQGEVDAIIRAEQEQAQLTNHGAGLALKIDEVQEQRATLRREHDEALARLEAERTPHADALHAARERLDGLRVELATITEAIAPLEAEDHGLLATQQELLTTQPPPPDAGLRLLPISRRRLEISNELARLNKRRAPVAGGVFEADLEITQLTGRVAASDEAIAASRHEFERRDKEFADLVDDLQREKAALDKKVRKIEGKKKTPFRELGRCLADNYIEPMNQPDSLERVLGHRGRIQALSEAIALSRSETRQANQRELQVFWTIVCIVAVLLVIGGVVISAR